MLTEEDQLNNCDIGTGTSPQIFIGCCLTAGFDFLIFITDVPLLVNRPVFRPGETYYFTSKLSTNSIKPHCPKVGGCLLQIPHLLYGHTNQSNPVAI